MRTSPRPTRERIGDYYPSDYAPFVYTRAPAAPPRQGPRPLWRRIAKPLLDTYGLHVGDVPPGELLEVGCASGAWLEGMRSLGWKVHGLEPNPEAAAFARERGLDVRTGVLDSETRFEGRYQLLAAWMVLEHLHDPIGGLEALRRSAAPGARLALSVPNAGALQFRLFKDRWFALQVPTHLFHYTPKTLEAVLQRAGWKLDRVFFQRSLSIEGASLSYFADDAGLPKVGQAIRAAAGRAEWIYGSAALSQVMAAFGQTGAMTAWATPA